MFWFPTCFYVLLLSLRTRDFRRSFTAHKHGRSTRGGQRVSWVPVLDSARAPPSSAPQRLHQHGWTGNHGSIEKQARSAHFSGLDTSKPMFLSVYPLLSILRSWHCAINIKDLFLFDLQEIKDSGAQFYKYILVEEDEAANVIYCNGTLLHLNSSQIPKGYSVSSAIPSFLSLINATLQKLM